MVKENYIYFFTFSDSNCKNFDLNLDKYYLPLDSCLYFGFKLYVCLYEKLVCTFQKHVVCTFSRSWDGGRGVWGPLHIEADAAGIIQNY